MAKKMVPGPMSRRITAILRSHKAKCGMSIRGLEAASGVNRGRVYAVLTDEQPILMDELEALAQALDLIGWQVVYEAETGEPYVAVLEADDFALAAKDPGYAPDNESDQ